MIKLITVTATMKPAKELHKNNDHNLAIFKYATVCNGMHVASRSTTKLQPLASRQAFKNHLERTWGAYGRPINDHGEPSIPVWIFRFL